MTPEQIAELEDGKDELRRLLDSIWRSEYRLSAPNWQPLPDLPGMVSQIDNMYAGVREQRDEAILAALKAQQPDAQAEPDAWLYEVNGVKNAYAYQLPDWSPSKGTETPLYLHPPKAQQPGEDVVERVARALAASDGLDFDEVCGVDADPDEGYCDSGTCIAAYWEEHDAEEARRLRMHHARAAIAAMQESRDADQV